MAGRGLYYNINKKRQEGRKMRKKGAKGAPTAADFKLAAKTARKASGGAVTKVAADKKQPKHAKGGLKIKTPKSAMGGRNTTKGPNPRDMMQSIFNEYHQSMGRRK
jgi:signal recognition particle subunit SEC65|tara:strand:+ start:1771 stop:2088 length:318 start_codon:yes stop_codon:yes gene_type:complete